jgi:hypothetical protein
MANLKLNPATAPGTPPDADLTQTGGAPMGAQAQKPQVVPENTPAPETTPTPEAAPNPFDPAALRLSLNTTEGLGVKKVIATIPVRKPNPQEYIRVHPHPDYRLTVGVIELKAEREIYLVTSAIARQIPGECYAAMIYTAINRAGVAFLWPVRLPSNDRRRDRWSTSSTEAAEAAMKRWVRIKADLGLGAYEWWEASANIPDPEWPNLTLHQMLQTAFKGGGLVDDLNHPALKQLRGE